MPGPLLEMKLGVPHRRRVAVPRARLGAQLDGALDVSLALVSAPAGFGKTTLLAEWAGGLGAQVAWVSLDARDDDPALFWAYVATALGSAAALARLDAAPGDIDPVVATMLNDLGRLDHEVVLVLDDYHVIATTAIQEAMGFLVEHLPPQAHVVLASRSDPPLPLARLRARGELVELRAADLRFTADEAEVYLNEGMTLGLSSADVGVLEARTEGWAAALQLAALSMQGRSDPSEFIAAFAGDHRYVVDYLAGEVLHGQPDDLRRFLLDTSILERFTGELCDAVTGGDDSAAVLERIERANLFLVPLDDRRQWYRYHHLFADVLRARLREEQPDRVDELHRRAGRWFADHGDQPEAIRHLLAGHDAERAADLIEQAADGVRQVRQEATLRGWLEALPDEVIATRPGLTIDLIGVRMVNSEAEGIEALLQQAERLLAPAVGAEDLTRRRLRAQIDIYRAGLDHLAGDVAATVEHGERALDLLDADDRLGRGSASALIGLARWSVGDLDDAGRRYTDTLAHFEAAGYLADWLGCAVALSDIRTAQGRLHDAAAICERGLVLAGDEGGGPVMRGAADMHVGLSVLLRERNDPAGAQRHLDRAAELGVHGGLPQNAYRWRVAAARLREDAGDLDGALALLDEAERYYFGDYSPDVRPVAASRARLRIVRGELGEAQRWADERQLSPSDAPAFRREFEHVTLARLLLARRAPEAAPFIARLLVAADQGGRTGAVIELLVLQAVEAQARGDVRAALVPLDRALALGAPQGHARVFLDEGPAMVDLLKVATKHGTAQDAARRILLADEDAHAARRSTAAPAVATGGLVDPLSERELDVLRLLRTELTGPEIARELVVSLNTVRTHTKHIFTKLGVTNRRAAVRRADELGL